MSPTSYKCPKCGAIDCEIGEIRAAGGFWSKIFNVQGKKFSTVICVRCRYTELYLGETNMAGNVLDFFTN